MKNGQIKLGRNEACFCGSGNKYKKCCLSVETKSFQEKLPFTGGDTRNKWLKQFEKRVKKEIGGNFNLFEGELEIKMSEIILHLADDLLALATTKSQNKQAITTACLAWNLAVMFDTQKQKEELDKLLYNEFNDPQNRVDLYDIVYSIIQKKNYYYPDICRIIIDFELIDNENNLHLHVASTLHETIRMTPD